MNPDSHIFLRSFSAGAHRTTVRYHHPVVGSDVNFPVHWQYSSKNSGGCERADRRDVRVAATVRARKTGPRQHNRVLGIRRSRSDGTHPWKGALSCLSVVFRKRCNADPAGGVQVMDIGRDREQGSADEQAAQGGDHRRRHRADHFSEWLRVGATPAAAAVAAVAAEADRRRRDQRLDDVVPRLRRPPAVVHARGLGGPVQHLHPAAHLQARQGRRGHRGRSRPGQGHARGLA